MNCGNSCPSIPRKRESTGPTSRPPLLSDHLYEIYDIPSMGGGPGAGTASQKKLLSQYNAEFDSEEDSNEDEKPLFMPITSFVPPVTPQATVVSVAPAVSTVAVPTVDIPIIIVINDTVDEVFTSQPEQVIESQAPSEVSSNGSDPGSPHSHRIDPGKWEEASDADLLVPRSLLVHQALALSVYSSLAVL
jgi:hypothetical protein